jgi:hypothetical protein
MRLPDFIILGAQKSATSFLHESLMLHPQIFMPPREVLYFEDPYYGSGDISVFARHFAKAPVEAVVGMKRPTSLGAPECPARIHHLLPNAKLLIVLRNPVERAISSYFFLMRNYRIPVIEPNAGLGAMLDGKGEGYARHPLELSLYGKHISRYLELFPRSQMHVIQQERLIARPKEHLVDVARMLGIDERKVIARSSPANPGMYHLGMLRMRHELRRIRHVRDERTGEIRPRSGVIGTPVNVVCRGLSMGVRKLNDVIGNRYKPVVSQEIRSRLQAYFQDDIRLTEELTGLDLSAWKIGRS